MKYIIDIPDRVKWGVVTCRTEDGFYTRDFDSLEELNSDYINEHYGDLQDDAYERGHGIGYQKGFEEGKAVSNKGCEGCKCETHKDGTCIMCSNNYMNQWAANDDEIKVGDEVYCKGDDTSDSGVVTWVGKKRVCTMWQDGSAGEVEKDELIKTNRHFDIASILKEMQS